MADQSWRGYGHLRHPLLRSTQPIRPDDGDPPLRSAVLAKATDQPANHLGQHHADRQGVPSDRRADSLFGHVHPPPGAHASQPAAHRLVGRVDLGHKRHKPLAPIIRTGDEGPAGHADDRGGRPCSARRPGALPNARLCRRCPGRPHRAAVRRCRVPRRIRRSSAAAIDQRDVCPCPKITRVAGVHRILGVGLPVIAQFAVAAAKPATAFEENLGLGFKAPWQYQPGHATRVRVLGPRLLEAVAPCRVQFHIIVNKGNPLAGRLRDRAVAGKVEPDPRLHGVAKRRPGRRRELLGRYFNELPRSLVFWSVVNHQDLDRGKAPVSLAKDMAQ